MYLLTPFLLMRLWWKGRSLPAYRKGIVQRFSLDTKKILPADIWVHAVSLGEVIAATPLIQKFLDNQRRVLVTNMTPTGLEHTKKQFGNKVVSRYVPYDIPIAIDCFLNAAKPKVCVIMETELWPNLITRTRQKNIPVFIVNARLSEHSFQGYEKIRWIMKSLLNQCTAILAQSPYDADRFKRLGAEESRVKILGNIKFDMQLQDIGLDKYQQLLSHCGEERIVVMLASTHEDEESQILQVFKALQVSIPKVLLSIAPRHPERFQKVYQLSQKLGFNTGLRSDLSTLSPDNEIVILDSFGEIMGFYGISDYAFVGGSFVPIGGHNVLQPIAMQVPVFTGKYIHNFKTICENLLEAQALIMVDNATNLVQEIISLHSDPDRKKSLVKKAFQVLEENKGSLDKYFHEIEAVL
jgi:3-deoxy-D-manno-octulosonic-acid transferase